MWDAVSWVLQTTTYYYHYRHYTRNVAVITRHHSSSQLRFTPLLSTIRLTRLREAGRCRVAAHS